MGEGLSMEENEHIDNGKVLHKTKAKLKLSHGKPEEVNCLVTESQVVIEAEKPIKIPMSRIRECCTSFSTYKYLWVARVKEPLSGTAVLIFLDDTNKKHSLSLEMDVLDLRPLKEAIDEQINKNRD